LQWRKANEAYSISEYDTALQLYSQLEESGLESWQLYYNMGNTYFKLHKLGKAILYYEKAYKINPSNNDIKKYLSFVRSRTVDKIDVVPEFVLTTFVKNFRNTFNSDTWALISVLSFAILILLVLFYRFGASGKVKRLSFFLAILACLFCIISFIFSANLRHRAKLYNYAIVSTPICNIKSAPNSNENNIFVLHEGTKIEILEQVGGWSKIELADGRQGWTEQKNYDLI
jgi:Bacterial SH3 domain./Tetratricopeptide repeat.